MAHDHWRLIKENISDPTVFKAIENSFVKRARVTAIVLGSFLIVALLAVVYGFVQRINAQNAEVKISELREQLDIATAEAQKQAALAIESRMIAEEAAKVAYEELEECRKKK